MDVTHLLSNGVRYSALENIVMNLLFIREGTIMSS